MLSGVLVQNGFKLSLMAPEDLREYAGLTTTTILMPTAHHIGCRRYRLDQMGLRGHFWQH